MGLFDRFKGRRSSEDALAQARSEAGMDASGAPVTPGAEPGQPAAPAPAPGDPNLGVPLNQFGSPTDGTQLPAGQNVQIPGVGDMGALMAMIQSAASQGHLHIDTQKLQMGMAGMQGAQGMQGMMGMGMPMLDLRQDPSRRQVVFDILKKHGFDPHEGQAIQVTDPQIQAEIMQALQQHAAGQQPQVQPPPQQIPPAEGSGGQSPEPGPPMPPGIPPAG
jgi:hypothetical protein